MCRLCQTKPVYEFTNKRKLCRTCYVRWFEKKVLYTIRKFEMLKRGNVVSYVKRNDFRSAVLEEVLKMIGDKGFVEITSGKKFDKFAIPKTIDLQAYEILDDVVNGNVRKLEKKNKKIIKPLYLFLDKEVELYARLKNLKYKKFVRKGNLFDKPASTPLPPFPSRVYNKSNKFLEEQARVKQFIDSLERRHPEIKRAIVNGVLNLN